MAELKTRPTGKSVTGFLKGIRDPGQRKDAGTLLRIMRRVTRARPRMWGPSIVGFGRYRYRYASGREGDWFLAGFSPRKGTMTVYIMSGFRGHETLLRRIGPHKKGGSCLYLKSLDTVNQAALEQLLRRSVKALQRTGS